MRTPELSALPSAAQNAARDVAMKLREHGIQAWIVGGATRDLALGIVPKDIDMASAATPSQIDEWFEISHEVGRAFGTVVLNPFGQEIQLTTFRIESGYGDQRRPAQVEFGTSLLEDAQRRDFRCNAIYLDPLTGQVMDPEGGLADLQAGLLRCVGDPQLRFREDGLRLLRMARFAARYDFQLDPETWNAARENREALSGVSAERILAELVAMLGKRGSSRAIQLVLDLRLLEVALPGWQQAQSSADARQAVLEQLPDPPGVELGLAILFGPALQVGLPRQIPDAELVGPLQQLRPSKRVLNLVASIAKVMFQLYQLEQMPSRAAAIRMIRNQQWSDGLAGARAWLSVGNRPQAITDRMEALARQLGKDDLFPEPLLTASQLIERGVKPGPLLGELIAQLEEQQLNQTLDSMEAADEWLERQLRRPS